jgi:asparagine synthase (glutamine-hydrolysing)
MCGIVGVFERTAGADEAVVRSMAAAIVHRGPDDEGYFVDGPVALGFRRLSIIDLRDGHQPMRSDCGRYTIVFNGEIYNHREIRRELEARGVRFRTNCDTEVLLYGLREWGEAALERMNGMFAFASWDATEHQLLLGRDRLGKKPLYFAVTPGGVRFASEVKALLRHPEVPSEVDRSRIPAYLTYRYVPGEETLFKGVRCVPPGSVMTVSADARPSEPRAYWELPLGWNARPPIEDVVDAESQLDALLSDAVKRRMVADVPVGAFLSGGLDSSLVVALMAASHPEPVKTFSIGFDTGFSEASFAADVAGRLRTDHHEVLVGASDLIGNVPRVMEARETPITEASDIPIYLLSRLARTKVTVVLSGEGADEIFAGYPKYAFLRAWGRAGGLVPRPALRALAGALPFGLRRLQLALEAMAEEEGLERQAAWFGAFLPREREALVSPELAREASPHALVAPWLVGRRFPSVVEEAQYLDSRFWLPANLLLRGDRMTMAHSLELRCPFLDYRLVELGARLPAHMRVRGRSGKWLLKRIARRRLPAHIVDRAKWGFKVPLAQWFRTSLAHTLRNVLLSRAALARGYFHEPELRRLIDAHASGRRNYEKQLWILLMLELWHLMFVDRTLGPTDPLA